MFKQPSVRLDFKFRPKACGTGGICGTPAINHDSNRNKHKQEFFLVFWGSHVSPVTTGDTTTKAVTKIWGGRQIFGYLISSSPFFFLGFQSRESIWFFIFFFRNKCQETAVPLLFAFSFDSEVTRKWQHWRQAGMFPVGCQGWEGPRASLELSVEQHLSLQGWREQSRQGETLSQECTTLSPFPSFFSKIKPTDTHKKWKSVMGGLTFISLVFFFPMEPDNSQDHLLLLLNVSQVGTTFFFP